MSGDVEGRTPRLTAHGIPASVSLPEYLSLGLARTSPVFLLSDGGRCASSVPFALVRPVHLTQDEFARDMICYDYRSLEPYNALITVNANGHCSIFYMRVTDPLTASFLNLRRRLGHPPIHP